MKSRGAQVHLLAILFSGLALGSLGLLEPLIRFGKDYHLLGVSWPWILLVYLGSGLAIAVVAGAATAAILALRPARRWNVETVAYHATATLALAAVVIAAPLVRHEALGMRIPLSYAVVFPMLLVIAGLLAWKLAQHLTAPLLGALIGRPGGDLAPRKVIALLVVVGLMVPITIAAEVGSRHHAGGRPLPELRTRPSDAAVQNVLFITIDALRADHLSLYGYPRPTSPNIDSLAAGAFIFDRCFAQGNSTELTMPAIFTSLYPSMHSVKRYGHIASPLPPEVETLAEHLRDAGLHTAGLMTNPFIKREWGLTQGFDEIDEFQIGHEELLPVIYLMRLGLYHPFERTPQTRSSPRAEVVVDKAVRMIHRFGDRPFYLHVHFMDTHHPYIPPVTYQDMFASPGTRALSAVEFWKRGWARFNQLPAVPLETSDVLRLIDLYDGSIRYVDEQIGRLLGELDAMGLSGRTLVVISSDHGDEFDEHGDVFHKSQFLYDELIHVPLIIRYPGLPGVQRCTEIVRQIDIMPTLLQIFDLPPSPSAQGSSLMPLLTGEGGWYRVPAYSESYEFMAVRTPEQKCMVDRRAGGRSYCFDLLTDPGERVDIHENSAPCDSLARSLMDFLRLISLPPVGRPGRELDDRTREQLRSIGYL